MGRAWLLQTRANLAGMSDGCVNNVLVTSSVSSSGDVAGRLLQITCPIGWFFPFDRAHEDASRTADRPPGLVKPPHLLGGDLGYAFVNSSDRFHCRLHES